MPTLADVDQLVAHPTAEMVARDPLGRRGELAAGAEPVLLAFDKMLSGPAAGHV